MYRDSLMARDSKESTCNVRGLGSMPELERFKEEGMATHSNIFAWKTPMVRGAWLGYSQGVAKTRT